MRTLELERSVGHNPITEIADSRYASLRSDWSSKARIGWNYQHKASCHSSIPSLSVPSNSEPQYSWDSTTHLNPPRMGPLVEI